MPPTFHIAALMLDGRSFKFYQADVFTGKPFGGNPVAVFPEAQGLTDNQLQQIAREMNLSESVFVFPPTDPAALVRLRIFTPTQELPFAGHPVLGTFYVLAKLGFIKVLDGVTRVMQECNIGLFPVEIHTQNGEVTRVVMTQPSPGFLSTVNDLVDLAGIAKALGLSISQIISPNCPVMVVSTGFPILIVPVHTLLVVRSIIPDDPAIVAVCQQVGVNGIMVFTNNTVERSASVHARMFAPLIGIPEDPATGSASGALGSYLVHNKLVVVGPVTEIIIEQGYEIERPSLIYVQIKSVDGAIAAVTVGGQVVLVVEGVLYT